MVEPQKWDTTHRCTPPGGRHRLCTTQIQRDDIGASFVIDQVQTAEDTIVLYSQIGPPNTADLTELKFGTGDVDAFGFFLSPPRFAFWAANGGAVPFKLTAEAIDVVVKRNGNTIMSGDDILLLLMGPVGGELLPSPGHATTINTGGTPVALEAGLRFLKTPQELGIKTGDRITFTALFKAEGPSLTPLPRATPMPTATPVVGIEPRYGEIIPMSAQQAPSIIHPVTMSLVEGLYVSGPIYSQLVRYDPLVHRGAVIIGDVAKSWEVSDDGLVYTFRLHENVRFTDGEELDADDVAFTINHILEPGEARPVTGKLRPYVDRAEK